MTQRSDRPAADDADAPGKAHWLELAKWLSDRLHNRQSYEWKITLGFWAVLLATTWRETTFSAADVSMGWWALAWLTFVLVWVRGVWISNENDKNRIERLFQHATGARTGPFADPPRLVPSEWSYWFGFLSNWSPTFQGLATAGIIAAIAKGDRSAISRPDSLETFWWGDGFALTWLAVTLAAGVLCCTLRWSAVGWQARAGDGVGS